MKVSGLSRPHCACDVDGTWRLSLNLGRPVSHSMEVYAIKVTLLGPSPPVWRRVLVQRDITLRNLHHTLQLVMGWTNSHLHQFVFRRQRYSDPRYKRGGRTVDESRTRLGDLIRNPGARLLYEYDLGDGWQHDFFMKKSCWEMSRSGKFVWRDSEIVGLRTVGATWFCRAVANRAAMPPRCLLPRSHAVRPVDREPCTAQRSGGGAPSSFDLLNRALFHNALTL